MIFRDQLEKVYALIEDEKRWTHEAFAKDAGGKPITNGTALSVSNDPEACSWCLMGAAYRCGVDFETDDDFVISIGLDMNGNGFIGPVIDWNDSHTHAEVLALLKSAIDRAPVREGAV